VVRVARYEEDRFAAYLQVVLPLDVCHSERIPQEAGSGTYRLLHHPGALHMTKLSAFQPLHIPSFQVSHLLGVA
jgi:hypothetical protein